MTRFLVAAVLLAASFVAFPAHAAQETGQVVAVVQSASAAATEGKRTLEAGMTVSTGERIETGRTGQVQFLFSDDTKMVVGPNSSLVIESYLLGSKQTAQTLAVTALGGTFRFITGRSPKQAYSIKTPAAAITVRGTSFDLAVLQSRADLLLFSGEVEICGIATGDCVLLQDACSLATAPRNADVGLERSRDRRNSAIRAYFPYAVSQASLRREFRVRTASCGDVQDPLPAIQRESDPGAPREPPAAREPPDAPQPEG